MTIAERWAKLRTRAETYLSPEARNEFADRLRLWNECRRHPPQVASARRRPEDWLALRLSWWESLWGNERHSLAHLKLRSMKIDPRAAVERQKREVHTYFRARVFPPDDDQAPDKKAAGRHVQYADRICRHVFTFHGYPPYGMGPSMDWNANPFADIEWPTALQRHYTWVDLSLAYRTTRRERYARTWARQLVDWISRSPVEPWSCRAFAWSTLNAAIRARTWSRVLPAMIRSPACTPEILLLFLAALRRNMNFLMTHAAPAGNWLLFESAGLFQVGACFHEFKDAAAWREEGRKRLTAEIQRQVLPDGAHIEMCPGYHATILHSFHNPWRIARQYGFAARWSTAYRIRLRKAYRFYAFLAKPDGEVLTIGDTCPADIRPVVRQGAQEFNDPALLFVASAGRKGRPPDSPGQVFRNSGHVVMRDTWRNTRRFLFFDVAPHGGWHSHRDSLQVMLWAFGQDLLVDSGCYRYSQPAHDEYGKTWRHNTVTVDEQSQDLSPPVLAGWKTAQNFTYAAGISRQWPGVQHLREVIFLESAFWLVLDLLVSDAFHAFQQWWHFGQSRAVLTHKNLCRTSNLALVSAGSADLRLQAGDVASYNQQWPRPVLRVERRGRGLIGFATLLYPHRKGEAPPISLPAFEPPATPEGQFRVSVQTPLGKTTLVCSGPWKRRRVICRP